MQRDFTFSIIIPCTCDSKFQEVNKMLFKADLTQLHSG